MVLTITIIGLAIALACFVVAAAIGHTRDVTATAASRTNWMAVGLAVWVLLQLTLAIVVR
jgi:F0F1-type ATP synthase membrane subunit c/vacuolar-type H+-ATPase subunit K